MSSITDPANTGYDFGQQFNYATWPKSTKIDLVNVPWNNDHRDVVMFPLADGTTLNQYITTKAAAGITLDKMSYLKPGMPVRINLPFNRVYKYNYLRASNPLQPVPGNDELRDYYYFITDVRYLAPNTTELVLQLDIFQTFSGRFSFGRCYVERGHIGIANSNAFNNYGRDYLTIPEGLDVGGEYQVVTKANSAVMSYTDASPGDENYNILVCSTVDLTADPGTKDDPNLNTANGGSFFALPSGANYYVFPDYVTMQNVFTGLADKPWITQGIISITAIPPIKRYFPSWTWPTFGWGLAPTFLLTPRVRAMFANWRNSAAIAAHIGSRYANLKKLWTYPYMAIELTTFSGSPVVLKPESWADDNATLVERIAPVPPNARVTFSPFKYNAKPGSATDKFIPNSGSNPAFDALPGGDDNGEWADIQTQISNFPSFAIVNNGAISYLAANRNSIAYGYSSASWAEQRALQANAVSYDQSTAGMQLSRDLTNIGVGADRALTGIQNNAAIQKAVLGAVGDVAGGIGGGAAGVAGGVAAAATRGVSTAIDVGASQAGLGVRVGAAQQSTNAQVGQQGLVRDTNKDLADWSARGDYANAVAANNARVQDAQLIQPTTSGQVGGEALALLNNMAVVSVRVKMIDAAAIASVGEYWLRYGYSIKRWMTMPSNLMVMSKFTYWKLLESYLVAATMPEGFKQVIRGIFEKGVTVWAHPDYIGVTDTADNTPIGGVTL